VRLARIASLVLLALLILAGCGERPAPAPTAPAPQPATEPALTIERPSIEPIRASGANGELRVTAEVAGRAEETAIVQVSADCSEPGCLTGAQADAAGNWTARVLLVGAGERRANVRVVAQSGAQVALGLARLTTHRAADKRTRRAARRTRRTAAAPRPAGSSTRRTAPAASSATAPGASSYGSSPAAPPRSAGGPASRMAMVGDSLAVGTKAPLQSLLAGWQLTTDARTGRPLAEGMRVIRGLAADPPPVLAVSLFTNDGPTSVRALQDAVRETISMQAGHGCVIWATIVRPPVGGRSYDGANAALARLADANPTVMRLVPWAQQVAAYPEWLAADGVHATPAGYTARAQLYASAARGC
jgi:hypothetical protein